MLSSTKVVWTPPPRKASFASRFCRKGMLVATPPILNSASAREVRRAATAKSAEGVCTMTLASRLSKDGDVS
jgi:hypothetical protein